ncbi:uncharacterized protein G2W53_014209 [Senna tora]|uniref:Uncharacterized protein n=1 Tax=Senna tora TaxID=362788 RepID=A0A834WT19_9FABA|nr:uncharacterized protein G2W53_014209 [Senna tora]
MDKGEELRSIPCDVAVEEQNRPIVHQKNSQSEPKEQEDVRGGLLNCAIDGGC